MEQNDETKDMARVHSVSNNTVYTDTLLELVDQYNNTKHSSVKMTPVEASKRSNKRIVYFNPLFEA